MCYFVEDGVLCFLLGKKQGLTFCLQNVMQKCLFVQQNALAREVFRGEKSGGRKKKRRKIALPKYIFAPGQNDYTHAPFGRLRCILRRKMLTAMVAFCCAKMFSKMVTP